MTNISMILSFFLGTIHVPIMRVPHVPIGYIWVFDSCIVVSIYTIWQESSYLGKVV